MSFIKFTDYNLNTSKKKIKTMGFRGKNTIRTNIALEDNIFRSSSTFYLSGM
jgi:hypothetical protein